MPGKGLELLDDIKALADRRIAQLSADDQREFLEELEEWCAQEIKDLDDYETDTRREAQSDDAGS